MKTMDASTVRGEFASVIEAVRETAQTVVVVRSPRWFTSIASRAGSCGR
jgi:hypothetical protein